MFALVVAVVAAVLVTTVSIDLGRFGKLKEVAEQQASKYLERPMRIGRLSALLAPGQFALDDVVIEGRTPQDRPFLTAKRIIVSVPWWTMFRREIVVQVRMTGWKMVYERWPDGHNLPRFTPRNPSTGPRKYRTTARFVYADQGEFIYDDHVLPWSIVATDLQVDIVRADNLKQYVGTARFSKGTLQIQQYRPMRAELSTRFTVEAPIVRMHHIDLVTDGFRSHVAGEIDFSKGPEQRYNVDATVDFARMREIFFVNDKWRLSGTGSFKGIFLAFKKGQELRGTFSSEQAGFNDLRFENLRGALEWLPGRFAVTRAESDFAGGRATMDYALEPLGTKEGATATFNTDYDGVDLQRIGGLIDLRGLDLRGRASGHLAMEWPNKRFATGRRGEGFTTITPPEGVHLAAERLPPAVPEPPEPDPPAKKSEFDGKKPIGPLAVGGDISYTFDASGTTFGKSWAATSSTYTAFEGRTDGEQSEIPFHVTSTNWQASDRLLVAIMTALNAPTEAIEVGGRGVFDGKMTGSFRAPRIAGLFSGESMKVWDVRWGQGRGDIVIENRYLDIKNGVIGSEPGPTIRANGRFSLGTARKDGGPEIDARIEVTRWPLKDLRHAFNLDTWPVDGIVSLPTLELTGAYNAPSGRGQLQLDQAVAWKETFETATAALTFDGKGGLRLDGIEMTKAPGQVTGAAYMNWRDGGTYSFVANGSRLAVESLSNFKVPRAPLTGVLQFTASGVGAFDDPGYEFSGRVADLFAADEGIGQVDAKFSVKNNELTILALNATSAPRLLFNGTGKIVLNEHYDADLSFRFFESSIDPYLKFFAPAMSPYTRAIVSGSGRVSGPLADPEDLLITTELDDVTLTLFDYQLKNDGQVRLSYEGGTARIGSLGFIGDGTKLVLAGQVAVADSKIDLNATGQANLAILQAFYPNLSSSGDTTLRVSATGDMKHPTLSGTATIANGRLRPLGLPQSLDQINGPITFDTSGVNIDGLTAQMGGGQVAFGGVISMTDYKLGEFNLTASGKDLRLRYPAGFASTVDMKLTLTGPVRRPVLGGSVEVIESVYTGRFNTDIGVLTLAAAGAGSPVAVAAGSTTTFPMDLNIEILAPRSTLRIQEKDVQIVGSAEMRLFGTLDRPLLTGSIDLDGEAALYGNRYFIQHGRIEFSDPTKFEPVFDIEAETRVRAAGQIYQVTVRFRGTFSKLDFSPTSEPFLPPIDIISLLLGRPVDLAATELNSRSIQERQAAVIQQAGAIILTSAVSSQVGQFLEKTMLVDTLNITPILGGDAVRLNPTARLTLGKRLSPTLYLTYSRALSGSQDEIILLEFEQSDKVSWILSRNEDRTFALDFRIRHVF